MQRRLEEIVEACEPILSLQDASALALWHAVFRIQPVVGEAVDELRLRGRDTWAGELARRFDHLQRRGFLSNLPDRGERPSLAAVQGRAAELRRYARELLDSIDEPAVPQESREGKPATPGPGGGQPASTDRRKPAAKVGTRSERGRSQHLIVGALTKHHKYEDGSCLHSEPAGVRELARKLSLSQGTVSRFFKEQFKDYRNYAGVVCRDPKTLAFALKMLNGELTPGILWNHQPMDELAIERV